ncbi:Protein of unknown function [Gryllus bimaculatus]|nr:Protein of unknown function [Gryllus bimaculatus]
MQDASRAELRRGESRAWLGLVHVAPRPRRQARRFAAYSLLCCIVAAQRGSAFSRLRVGVVLGRAAPCWARRVQLEAAADVAAEESGISQFDHVQVYHFVRAAGRGAAGHGILRALLPRPRGDGRPGGGDAHDGGAGSACGGGGGGGGGGR